jgi:hypothetical protein
MAENRGSMSRAVRNIAIAAVCMIAAFAALYVYQSWQADQEQQAREQQMEQANRDFAPLLARTQSLYDGTADPAPSEERDGKLYLYAEDLEDYPNAVRVEATLPEIIDASYEGDDEATVTVKYRVARYRADRTLDSGGTYEDTWRLRKTDGDWVVYDLSSKP